MVNIVYIDQPAQTGLSYDKATPGVLNTLTGDHDVTGALSALTRWSHLRAQGLPPGGSGALNMSLSE